MACEPVKLPGGAVAIVCSRGARSRPKTCAFCSAASSRLCDYPVEVDGRKTTCSAPLCDRCTTRIGKETDLCRTHAPLWRGVQEKESPGDGNSRT